MSDIPIGSPPVPPGRHAAPSGWYPDPVDLRNERYWDGWQWSRSTRPGAGAPADPGPRTATRTPGPYAPAPQSHQSQPFQPQAFQPPYAQPFPPSAARPAGGKATATADGVALAGWGWRALAAVIDAVFVGILTTLPAIPLLRRVSMRFMDFFNATVQAAQTGQPPPVYTPETLMSVSEQMAMTGILLAVGMAYHALFLRFVRATPGKMLAGLKVVPFGHGRATGPLPWGAAVLRATLWVVPQLWLCLLPYLILDCLFPLWQPNRQAVHDRAARTQVIRVRS